MALNRMVLSVRSRASDAIRPRGLRRDVLAMFTVHVVSFLISLAMASVTARWLGAEGKGTLSLMLLGSGFLALLLGGGVSVANVYFAASGRLPVSALTGFSVSWTLLATATAAVLIAGITILDVRVMPGLPQWGLWAVLSLVPWMVLGNNFSGILQGAQQILAVSRTRMVQSGLTLLLTVALVTGMRWSVVGALGAVLASHMIGVAMMTGMLRPYGARLRPSWPDQVRSVTAFGLKGHVANLLQFLNYRLDMFIVSIFLGPAAVGIYGVAVSLAELLWFLPDAVGFAVFPRTASGNAAVRTVGWRYAVVTIAATAAGALLLAAVAPAAIVTIFSPAFMSAYPALLALLPGAVLMSGAKVLANDILGRGYPQYNAITAGIALTVTITLDVLLIPSYGIVGAAVATSLAYATVFLSVVYLSTTLKRNQLVFPAPQMRSP